MAASRARWQDLPAADPVRVHLAIDRLIQSFEETLASAAEVDRFFTASPKLVIFYEDLAAHFAVERARILDFLGVRGEPVTAVAPASRERNLLEVIDNYDQVERALAGTPWETFLAGQ